LQVEDLRRLLSDVHEYKAHRWTYHIGARIACRQDIPGIGSGHDEVGNDGNGFDLLRPVEFPVMTDPKRRFWWSFTSVNASSRGGKHLTQRNLFACYVFRLELI
jgi:hypothetical protein